MERIGYTCSMTPVEAEKRAGLVHEFPGVSFIQTPDLNDPKRVIGTTTADSESTLIPFAVKMYPRARRHSKNK